MPKTKNAQNNLKMPELAIKSKMDACGPNMSSSGAREPLEEKFDN